MQINNWKSILIVSTFFLSLGMPIPAVKADTYGGGETEISLKIVKEVRLAGDTSYKDKVFIDLTDPEEKAKEIYFRMTVTNIGTADLSSLKMEDFLPSELNKLSGDLTEEWGSLAAGEEKTFVIKANLKDGEIKEDKDYEKCVVNKAEIRRDGNFAGSDVATVCYGNKPVELPKTGFLPMSGFAGLGMLSLGGLLGKKKKSKTKKKK